MCHSLWSHDIIPVWDLTKQNKKSDWPWYVWNMGIKPRLIGWCLWGIYSGQFNHSILSLITMHMYLDDHLFTAQLFCEHHSGVRVFVHHVGWQTTQPVSSLLTFHWHSDPIYTRLSVQLEMNWLTILGCMVYLKWSLVGYRANIIV